MVSVASKGCAFVACLLVLASGLVCSTAQTVNFRGAITSQVTTTASSSIGIWRYQSSSTAGQAITATTTTSSFHTLSVRRCFPDVSDFVSLPIQAGEVASAQSSNGQSVTVGACRGFSTSTPFFITTNTEVDGSLAVSESAETAISATTLSTGTTTVDALNSRRVYSLSVPADTQLVSVMFAITSGALSSVRLEDSCGKRLTSGCDSQNVACVLEATPSCGGVTASTLFLIIEAPSIAVTMKINLQYFSSAAISTTALTRGSATTLPSGPFSVGFYSLPAGSDPNNFVRLTVNIPVNTFYVFITAGKNGKPGVNFDCTANNVCNRSPIGGRVVTFLEIDANALAELGTNNVFTIRVMSRDGTSSTATGSEITLTPVVTTITPTVVAPGTSASPMAPVARSSVTRDVFVISASLLSDPRSYLHVALTGISGGEPSVTLGRGGFSNNAFFGCVSADESLCSGATCNRVFASCAVPGSATGDFYLSILASSGSTSYSISINVINAISIDSVGTAATGTIRAGWPQIFLFPAAVTSVPFSTVITTGSVSTTVRELTNTPCSFTSGTARTGSSFDFTSMCPTQGASRPGIILTGGSSDTSYSVTVTAVSATSMTAGAASTWAGSNWPAADTTRWWKYTSTKAEGFSLNVSPVGTDGQGITVTQVWAPSCKNILSKDNSFRTGNWWNLDPTVNAAGDYFIGTTRTNDFAVTDRTATIKVGRPACVDNNPNNNNVADLCKSISNYQLAFGPDGAPSAQKAVNDYTVLASWYFANTSACSDAVKSFVCKYTYASCDTDGLRRQVACKTECDAARAACPSETVCLPAMCNALPSCTAFNPPSLAPGGGGGSSPSAGTGAPSGGSGTAPTGGNSGAPSGSSGGNPTASATPSTGGGSTAPKAAGTNSGISLVAAPLLILASVIFVLSQ